MAKDSLDDVVQAEITAPDILDGICRGIDRGPTLTHLAIVKDPEDFDSALRDSGMPHAVIRPTGFFTDMEEYLRMGRRGRVYLLGSGDNRINPIHGADLLSVPSRRAP